MINYLTALQVNKSVYEYVQYDSEVEREFAKRLDEREDIKLFVKLPGWFVIDTPVGTYNPDWAILKHDGQAPQDLYQQIVTWAEEMKVDASLLKAITGAAAAPPADYVHHQG